MVIGFTGTSTGMTQRQAATVKYLFTELKLTELHHGDCIGADAQAHNLARDLKARIVVHPPSDPKLRAFCMDADIRKPLRYLRRNRHIIKDGVDGLIAAPKDFLHPANPRGQGTWTTVGYARQAGRRIWLVFPDGTFREEAARSDEEMTKEYLASEPIVYMGKEGEEEDS